MKKTIFVFSLLLPILMSCSSVAPVQMSYLDTTNYQGTLARVPIIQGATADTETQVGVFHRANESLEVSLWDSQSKVRLETVSVSKHEFSGHPTALTHYHFSQLKPKTDYWLQVYSNGKLVDLRKLRSLDTSKRKVVFAIASCMDDDFSKEQKPMWEQLLSAKPEVIFMIGDNVYADKKIGDKKVADPNDLWRRYSETRAMLEVFRSPELTPVIAAWDDHDYGVNDGDRTYPHKEKSLEVLNAFFPRAAIAGKYELGPGASSHFSAFGQDFTLMDARSFRSSPKEANTETHWGQEQESFLWKHVGQASSVDWIMNGDQFFGAYHRFESYERLHPQSFQAFLNNVKKARTPVILVSGDRHLAELQKLTKKDVGYTTYELTTSAIHAKTYPNQWKDTPNPRKLEGADGVLNYMLITAEPRLKGRGVDFVVTAYGPENRELFSKKLTVKK